jgi:hypothetical protein
MQARHPLLDIAAHAGAIVSRRDRPDPVREEHAWVRADD